MNYNRIHRWRERTGLTVSGMATHALACFDGYDNGCGVYSSGLDAGRDHADMLLVSRLRGRARQRPTDRTIRSWGDFLIELGELLGTAPTNSLVVACLCPRCGSSPGSVSDSKASEGCALCQPLEDALDRLTRELTAHATFAALLDADSAPLLWTAQGSTGNSPGLHLANAYDDAQRLRGDPRRSNRGM